MTDRAFLMVLREIFRKRQPTASATAELLGVSPPAGTSRPLNCSSVGISNPRVRRLPYRTLRDFHDAEDAFQATFLALARPGWTDSRKEARRPGCSVWLVDDAVSPHRTRPPAPACDAGTVRRKPQRETDARPLTGRAPAPGLAVDEAPTRLPGRVPPGPPVLCYLEGKTVDAAPRLLRPDAGCPDLARWLPTPRQRLLSRWPARRRSAEPNRANSGRPDPRARAGSARRRLGQAAGEPVSLTSGRSGEKAVTARARKRRRTSAERRYWRSVTAARLTSGALDRGLANRQLCGRPCRAGKDRGGACPETFAATPADARAGPVATCSGRGLTGRGRRGRRCRWLYG